VHYPLGKTTQCGSLFGIDCIIDGLLEHVNALFALFIGEGVTAPDAKDAAVLFAGLYGSAAFTASMLFSGGH